MSPAPPSLPPSLIDALARSRAWGFLGDGPIEDHIAHAQGFADAAASVRGQGTTGEDGVPDTSADPRPWMDLGSGGGIPGLVLAHLWPDRDGVLLDSNQRRTRFLSQVIDDQGWAPRVRVVVARAETAGRSDSLRGTFSLVVARSFGAPPVTAECASPFLRRGGILIVSEPPAPLSEEPGDDDRWPREGLDPVGLEPLALWRDVFGYRILRQRALCPDRYPRRIGIPGKRPLYRVG
jgi:16S rRNA (guanine527-N7)-methyltransferase